MAAPFDFRRLSPSPHRNAGFGEAFERVYDASHALVARRIELGAAEAALFARAGAALLVAAVAALVGWLYAVSGVVDALSRDYPRFAVEIGVGALHIAGACALFAVAWRGAAKQGERE